MSTDLAIIVKRRRRSARVLILYALALLKEFRATLLALIVAVAFGGFLYAITPHAALGGQRPDLWTALYGGWMAMLAQPLTNPPERWYLTAMCGFYPLIGAVLIGEGIVRLAMLMMSRRYGEKEWMRVMASTYRDHIVLCGVGKLGIRVLEQLVAANVPVVAIEKRRAGHFVPRAREMDIPLMIRDMKEDQALIDAGIKSARAIIVATNDSMANLEVALDARRMNPDIRVIVRMFDEQIAGKIAGAMHFDAAFSSSTLAAPVVAAMALQGDCSGTKVLSAMLLGGVPYVVIETPIDAGGKLHGQTIDSIESTCGVRVLAHATVGEKLHAPPSPTSILAAGDRLVVHTPASKMAFWSTSKHATSPE